MRSRKLTSSLDRTTEIEGGIKYSAAKDEDKPKVMASIVEGLRGDAGELAKDIGIEELLKKDTGLERLTAAIKKLIFSKVVAQCSPRAREASSPARS